MSRTVRTRALTAAAFAPFGDVLEAVGAPDKVINQGLCGRHHDRAEMDFSDGRAGVSVFNAEPRTLPLTLEMMERHPDGSQAFIPMHQHPYLVIVAADESGAPGEPAVFIAAPGQGVNYHRNVWHGVLCPLHAPGLFAVVDRIGAPDDNKPNLEEHWFDRPWRVERTSQE